MPDARHATKRAVPLRKTPQKRTSAPVIDLGVLNERLGYFIRRAQLWVFQDFIRRLSSIDISPAEFSVLVVIGANTGLSQAELAATLGIERARLVRLLHRLERRDLTQRLAIVCRWSSSCATAYRGRPKDFGARQNAGRTTRSSTERKARRRTPPVVA